MKIKSLLTAVAFVAIGLLVQSASADFTYDGSDTTPWSVDRYAPNLFTSVTFPPSQSAYAFGIGSTDDAVNRPAAYSAPFYNTQGVKTSVNGTTGAWSYSADLYVTPSMLAGTYQPLSTEMWPGTGVNSGYYVMGFISGVSARSYGAAAVASSQIEVFDDTTGLWSYYSTAGMVVGWNQLMVSYDGAGTVNYSVDGSILTSQGSAITSQDPSVADFSTAYLENYNFYQAGNVGWPQAYNTYWTAVTASTGLSVVPEPTTVAVLGFGGLASLMAARRKRK